MQNRVQIACNCGRLDVISVNAGQPIPTYATGREGPPSPAVVSACLAGTVRRVNSTFLVAARRSNHEAMRKAINSTITALWESRNIYTSSLVSHGFDWRIIVNEEHGNRCVSAYNAPCI